MLSLFIRSSDNSGNEFSRTEGERHNRQHRIEATVCYMERPIYDEQIVVIVNASPFVRNGTIRIVAHAAGAGLMLSPAQYQTRLCTPNLFTTTGAHPFLAALSHELSGFDGSAMSRATKPSHGNSPLV